MNVFVDTSALLALVSSDDLWHDDAVRTFRALVHNHLVTTNYVVVETLQLARRRLGALATESLRANQLPLLEVVHVDEATHAAAYSAYRPTGGPSIVDETSFIVMRRLGIDDAFAYDTDFDHQGFRQAAASTVEPNKWLREERAHYRSASDADLVSIREIASRSGRSVNTVQSWRRRHPEFPAPLVQLAAAPVWEWPTIEAWLAGRG